MGPGGSRRRAVLRGHVLPLLRRVRMLGSLTVAAVLLMGVFAAVAHASSVTNVSVTNTSPTDAEGARTVYSIGFDTSATGGLSAAQNSSITITFPSGTGLGNVNSSQILTANNANIGSCSLNQTNLTATCQFFSNETVAASTPLTVQLGGVVNPPAIPGALQSLQVQTSADATPVAGTFPVVSSGQITKLSVNNTSPTDAAGSRTVYSILFDTSGTGGMSTLANSAITITFPSGTGFSNVNSSQILTANNTDIGSCSLNQTTLTATCQFFSNETVGAGSPLTVQLGGVTNPPALASGGEQSLSVQTTSDPTSVNASYPVVANHAITNVSVTNTAPTDAATARTVYSIGFTTSSTGAMSTLANSAITITFPSGTGFSNVNSSQILTANNTNIGSCSLNQTTLTATCQFFSNETVAATTPLTVQLGGVTTASTPTGTQTLSVQTTSDPTSVNASYPVVANHAITNVSVTNTAPTDAATARTVYSIGFTTSSTGAMSTLANSAITITFPSGTGFSNVNSSQILTANNTNIGSCSLNQTTLTATCQFFSNETVAATTPLTVQLGGVTTASTPTGTQTLSVQTTSDPTSVNASYPVVANHAISQPSVALSNTGVGATGVTYSVAFSTSSTGALSTLANSAITITFPSGTGLNSVNSSQILTANNTNIGSCSLNQTNLTATCQFFSNETVAGSTPLIVKLGGITNPSSNIIEMLSVQTTSDPTPVASGHYNIGSGSAAPTVTGINPASGPTSGGTAVMISGTNLTDATSVQFGLNAATNVNVVSPTQITATSPPGSAGTLDVTVTTPGGTSATSNADQFTYNAPSPAPSPGPGPGPAASSRPTVSGGSPTTETSTGATASGTVNPESQATTAFFQYGLDPSYRGPGADTTLYDQSTAVQQVGSDAASHTVSAPLSGLVPGALYHIRLVATNSMGTTFGPDLTFTTPAAPPPGQPVLGQTENAQTVSGTVFIKLPSGAFVKLTGNEQIPSGAEIDALGGSLKITTATAKKGKTQQGVFGGAVFKLTQASGGASRGLATLAIVEGAFSGAPSYATCKAHKALEATAASSRTLQLLHASAHGKFRTKGKYSAATVLGTIWTVADRCDGTLTHDVTDSVVVNDFVHHKTIVLHAGQSYLAKAPGKHP